MVFFEDISRSTASRVSTPFNMLDDSLKNGVPGEHFAMVTKHGFKDWLHKHFPGKKQVKFELRECGGVVRVDDKKITIFSSERCKDSDVVARFEYVGFFPCGIYGGSIQTTSGGCILIATADGEFVSVTGGYPGGPFVEENILLQDATAGKLQCCYTVVSGGDPGALFAMSPDYIHFIGSKKGNGTQPTIVWMCGGSDVINIKRDKRLEAKYCDKNKAEHNFPVLVDMYLTIEMGQNRCFGYNKMKMI